MSCYHPIDCWRVPDLSAPSGHRIVFGSPGAPPERGAEPITIPCGKCIGCRLAHSRAWAVRCVHESTLHEHNCFLTLTFDDDHLPSDHSVHVRDVQLFLKRLRKSLGDVKVRFFACGEYGEKMIALTIILLSLGMILLMIASYCDKQHTAHYSFLIISFVCGLLAFTLSAMLLSSLVLMWRGT